MSRIFVVLSSCFILPLILSTDALSFVADPGDKQIAEWIEDLGSKDSLKVREAALELIDLADGDDQILRSFFDNAFEEAMNHTPSLLALLKSFSAKELAFSTAHHSAIQFLRNELYTSERELEEIGRQWFKQKFLASARVWKNRMDVISEVELQIHRLYTRPGIFQNTHRVIRDRDEFEVGVRIAAMDSMWWIYVYEHVQIQDLLSIALSDPHPRVLMAALEPLEFLYPYFNYPELIPFLERLPNSEAYKKLNAEDQARVDQIAKTFIDYGSAHWRGLTRWREWLKREEELRGNPAEAQQAKLKPSQVGSWTLDRAVCIDSEGNEMPMDMEEDLDGSIITHSNGDFVLVLRSAEWSVQWNGKLHPLQDDRFLMRPLESMQLLENAEPHLKVQYSLLETAAESSIVSLIRKDHELRMAFLEGAELESETHGCENHRGSLRYVVYQKAN